MLYPIQQFISLLGKIPGVGKFVDPALKFIENMRANLNIDAEVSRPTEKVIKNSNTTPFIPSTTDQHFYNSQTVMQKSGRGELNINVNDRNNVIKNVSSRSDSNFPIVTTTQGQR